MLVATVGSIQCILVWMERIAEAMSTYRSLLSQQRALGQTMVEIVGRCVRKENHTSERPRIFN